MACTLGFCFDLSLPSVNCEDVTPMLSMAWDYENRLTSYRGDLSTNLWLEAPPLPTDPITYQYDGLGRRVCRTDEMGVTRRFVLDRVSRFGNVLVENDGTNGAVRRYVWAGPVGLLAIVEADGTVRYPLCDEQGSVLALTDSAGNVTDQFCYSPYGELWNRTGTSTTAYTYLGGLGVRWEGGPMYFCNARYYDARQARFLNADPIGLAGGANLYMYAMGNPAVFVDPSGWCARSLPEIRNSRSASVQQVDVLRPGGQPVGLLTLAQAGRWGQPIDPNMPWAGQEISRGLQNNMDLDMGIGLGPVTEYGVSFAMRLLGRGGAVVVGESETTILRARHFSDATGLAGIESDMAINASSSARGAGTELAGVHVELQPFGPVSTASSEMGSVAGGRGFVEFDTPANMVRTSVGPRNTAIIPTTTPLPLQNLNPTFVAPSPWWKVW
jgi:RHS repeat-associated protein